MSTTSEKVVLVLGPCGVGKSQLISHGANLGGRGVVHSLGAGTERVEIVRTTLNGEPVVFIDTPGFDESFMSPITILTAVSETLDENKLKVDMVLYLHRITDNRMAGSILKNLGLFQGICGGIAMQNVIVVLTMCGKVPIPVKDARLAELKRDYWAEIAKQGATFACFGDSISSVRDIVLGAHEEPKNPEVPRTRPVSEPPRFTRRPHRDTVAGIALNQQLESLIRDKKKYKRRMDKSDRHRHRTRRNSTRADMRRIPAVRDRILQAEKRRIDQGIEETVDKLRQLNAPLSRVVRRLFVRKKS
ncbi:SubName: Full=Uncharacterized protein {ECO:0000313/EMBL:CCA72588.1} [Serendipita indica DSM 11827]|nr:SubName: Full=Uncharacterized protein {ECO:0000313/EMBL:CCA72588.1} [Serendipita indica DSM 11827]